MRLDYREDLLPPQDREARWCGETKDITQTACGLLSPADSWRDNGSAVIRE